MNSGNGFYFAAGVLAMAALLFVLYPWLAGKPRAAMLSALPRWVPVAGAVAIAAALALYIRLGSPQLTDRDATTEGITSSPVRGGPTGMAAGAAPGAAGSMDSAVAGLERRLASGGGGDGDWELLAKSYEFLGRTADAAGARQKRLPAGAGGMPGAAPAAAIPAAAPLSAAALKQVAAAEEARGKREFSKSAAIYAGLAARNEMNADTWANYADVAGALNNNSLAGQPAAYIANALRLDPQHAKALWLQASLEHETHQYQAAVGTWQRLIAVLGAGSADGKLIAANLAEDQRLAGASAEGLRHGPRVGGCARARGCERARRNRRCRCAQGADSPRPDAVHRGQVRQFARATGGHRAHHDRHLAAAVPARRFPGDAALTPVVDGRCGHHRGAHLAHRSGHARRG